MTFKKLFSFASTLLISGSILLAGGAIASPLETTSFGLADIVLIVAFIFLIVGLVSLIVSLCLKEKNNQE